jgi:branched-chain amino acid transport system ATP-binding protein
LRSEKITALFVEHDMDVVERYADRVLVWDSGRVMAEGAPREVLAKREVIERVVGVA